MAARGYEDNLQISQLGNDGRDEVSTTIESLFQDEGSHISEYKAHNMALLQLRLGPP